MKLSPCLFASLLCFSLIRLYEPTLAQENLESDQDIPSETSLQEFYCDDPEGIVDEYYRKRLGQAETKSFQELKSVLSQISVDKIETDNKTTQTQSKPSYYATSLDQVIEIATGKIDNSMIDSNQIDSVLAHIPSTQIYNRNLLQESLDVQKQQQSLRATRADLYPSLSTSANIGRTGKIVDNHVVNGENGTTSDNSSNIYNTPLGASLQLNYTIFDAKRSANIKVNKLQLDRSFLNWKIRLNSVQLDVENAFYSVQQNRENVKIDLDNLNNGVCEALKRAKNKREKDIAIASLFKSVQKLLENGAKLDQSLYALAKILGLPGQILVVPASGADMAMIPGEDFNLEEELKLDVKPTPKAKDIGFQESIQAALNNRSELKRIDLLIQVNQAQRKANIAAIYPTLSFDASAGVSQSFTDTFKKRPIETATENDAFSLDYKVGLNFKWKFFDGGKASANSKRSVLDVRRNELEFVNTQDTIRQEVVDAHTSLRANYGSICSAGIQVKRTQGAYEKSLEAFESGSLDFDDLDQARSARNTAQANYVTTVLNFNRSWARLERALETDNLQNAPLIIDDCL